MSQHHAFHLTRRRALTAGAAAVAAATLPAAVAARPLLRDGFGAAAGGTVERDDGDCTFVLLVTRLTLEGEDGELLIGHLTWSDPSSYEDGLYLDGAEFTDYGPVPDHEGTSEARGQIRVNSGDLAPFVIRLEDSGDFGSGEDRVTLTVGEPGSNFEYRAEGRVVYGDIELLQFVPTAGTSNGGY
jgi:hypothetical protein